MFDNLIAAILLSAWFDDYCNDCSCARRGNGPEPTRAQFIQANTGRRFGPLVLNP